MRTVIGITCSLDEIEGQVCLREDYVKAVMEARGIPMILPAVSDVHTLEQYISLCDGFILSGGGDVHPRFWGEPPITRLRRVNPVRDQFEVHLATRIIQTHKPVLGICRGCQVLNVAAGGTLWQDIGTGMSHEQNAPRSDPFHDIFIAADSRLAVLGDAATARVNSFHHQAVNRLGSMMVATATAPDGTIEAIESKQDWFMLGVQWHPESLNDVLSRRLFRSLVEAVVSQSIEQEIF